MLLSLLSTVVLTTLLSSQADASTCSQETVTLRGDWGQASFTIEVADEPEEHARGLMHRDHMDDEAGMLFVFSEPVHAKFWMENTLIPLDMLFIDKKGVISTIHRNAVPMDRTVIDGGPGVLAVLEVNAGISNKLAIEEGDELLHPAFGPGASWACGAS